MLVIVGLVATLGLLGFAIAMFYAMYVSETTGGGKRGKKKLTEEFIQETEMAEENPLEAKKHSQVEWDIRNKLVDIKNEQTSQRHKLESIECAIREISCDINKIEALLKQLFARVIGEDLTIKFSQGVQQMKKFQMTAKGSKASKQVMPPQNWSALSAAGGAGLQLIDANGAAITGVNPSEVTTTLVANDAGGAPSTLVTVTPGADSLSYTLSKAAGVTGKIFVAAGLTYNSGSPGPFTSSIEITLDSPVATDLQIIFGAT